jgi:hypothetical protein
VNVVDAEISPEKNNPVDLKICRPFAKIKIDDFCRLALVARKD